MRFALPSLATTGLHAASSSFYINYMLSADCSSSEDDDKSLLVSPNDKEKHPSSLEWKNIILIMCLLVA